uniref:Small ribosomal subunit protein uS19 n=1 Tax=uncultured Nitrospirae bacterium Rifle_16ft_4_minimus_14985 TaxID=1665124 RepID=A0A0H4T0V3_9BACT|nr:hypothetical protein [uncultured Nitrospirae bacterium Rifle_16ft_4_minimus_14985]
MPRSVKKGPFIDASLLAKIEKMNRNKDKNEALQGARVGQDREVCGAEMRLSQKSICCVLGPSEILTYDRNPPGMLRTSRSLPVRSGLLGPCGLASGAFVTVSQRDRHAHG